MKRPFIAAALIVKDESETLPRCLQSVCAFVDEIVVYDTGSTDGTPELAASLGARVVRGYWDDDFSRARNAALDEVRATWVIQVDADEELVGDPVALRRQLTATGDAVDAFSVLVGNVQSDGSQWRFPAHRLFRRSRVRHVRPLHEQLAARSGTLRVAVEPPEALHILHYGYAAEAMSRKRGRNAAIAQRAVERAETEVDKAHWTVELARSKHSDGDVETALTLLATVAEPTSKVGARALSFLAYYRHLSHDDQGCLDAVQQLRGSVESRPRFCDLMDAESYFRLGDKARALEHLDRIDGPIHDVDQFELPAGRVAFLRSCCLGILGRHAEAADAALDAARLGPVTLDVTYVLMRMWEVAGRDPRDLVASIDGELADRLHERLLPLPATSAIPFLAALAAHAGRNPVVAHEIATLAARELTLAELAEPFLAPTGASALRVRSTALTLAGPERFQAAAIAYATVPDGSRRQHLYGCGPLVQPTHFEAVLLDLDQRCPQILPDAVAALATTVERRELMASLLRRLGEDEAAEQVLAG